MTKKLVKDLTKKELIKICTKARTKKNGKVKSGCAGDECPLYYNGAYPEFIFNNAMKTCEIVNLLNQEIEVEEDE